MASFYSTFHSSTQSFLFSIDYGVIKTLENRHPAAIARNSGLLQPLRMYGPLKDGFEEMRLA
jgi:hypothetical protein